MNPALTVGIDVGGTKIAAGVVETGGRVVERRLVPSPAGSADALVDVIVDLVAELGAGHPIAAVGLCVAGFVDADASTVVTAPNLAWRNLPLRALVAERTGLPVVVENDGNAAAWGERILGAGRGVDDLLMVAVGTGVGGGIVLGGELRRGGHGMAAEIGHLTLVPGENPVVVVGGGCLEQYASGSALVRAAQAVLGNDPTLDGPTITALARRGDVKAVELMATLGTHLGCGIASLVAVLDPSVVVVGGGVAAAGDLLLEPIRIALRSELPGGASRPAPEIVSAALGNDAGVIGVAQLAQREVGAASG